MIKLFRKKNKVIPTLHLPEIILSEDSSSSPPKMELKFISNNVNSEDKGDNKGDNISEIDKIISKKITSMKDYEKMLEFIDYIKVGDLSFESFKKAKDIETTDSKKSRERLMKYYSERHQKRLAKKAKNKEIVNNNKEFKRHKKYVNLLISILKNKKSIISTHRNEYDNNIYYNIDIRVNGINYKIEYIPHNITKDSYRVEVDGFSDLFQDPYIDREDLYETRYEDVYNHGEIFIKSDSILDITHTDEFKHILNITLSKRSSSILEKSIKRRLKKEKNTLLYNLHNAYKDTSNNTSKVENIH